MPAQPLQPHPEREKENTEIRLQPKKKKPRHIDP